MMKPKKLPRDANSLAARIVALSTGQEPPKLTPESKAPAAKPEREKNPAAVATKPTGRRFASVAELMRIEGVSSEVQTKFQEIANETRIVCQLTKLRHMAGLTQEDMAQRLNVSQSAVSKLESGRDEDLTLGNIREYAKSSGERIGVVFGKPLTHVESVKAYANGMRTHLSALANLAHKGDDMEKEIQAFFGEAFFNILSIFARIHQSLRVTPAMEAGVSDHVWTLDEIIALLP